MPKPIKIKTAASVSVTPKPRGKNCLCDTNECGNFEKIEKMYEVRIQVPGWAAWVMMLCQRCVDKQMARRKHA